MQAIESWSGSVKNEAVRVVCILVTKIWSSRKARTLSSILLTFIVSQRSDFGINVKQQVMEHF